MGPSERAQSLHGPWPDDGQDELHALRASFGHAWRIWRAMKPDRTPGEWCALRVTPAPETTTEVVASTAAELRQSLGVHG